MTIRLIYSTASVSGTRWKFDRWHQWELSFWKWVLEPLWIVCGILFGAIEVNQNDITFILFSDTSFWQRIFSKLNLVFNQGKFYSIFLILYCYGNTTWNGWFWAGYHKAASPIVSSDQAPFRAVLSPECRVCLVPPVPRAMLAHFCAGTCDESE